MRQKRTELSDSTLKTMADEHVTYEIRSLLAATLVPEFPPLLVGLGGVSVRFDAWIVNVRLEAAMVHLRCLYAFLTGINAHATDVIAADYFEATDGWSPHTYVLGKNADEQQRIVDNINRRIHHIGQQRVESFTWKQVTPEIPRIAEKFLAFVADLARFDLTHRTDRAEWFADAVEDARVCARLQIPDAPTPESP